MVRREFGNERITAQREWKQAGACYHLSHPMLQIYF